MVARVAPGDYDQLHHFVAAGRWDEAPLEAELLAQADRLVGGDDAVLVVDDTALPKKGRHLVGVAPQYATVLGKQANCQTLVSLTLAREEVPAPLALRLYLPPAWTDDAERLRKARVPDAFHMTRSKGEIALAEIDRVMAAGVRFSAVLAGAGYGISAAFPQALSARGPTWAIGIPRIQKVFTADVAIVAPPPARRHSRQPLVPAVEACAAETALTGERWRTLTWRQGTKGTLKAAFAARRVRVADGAAVRLHGRSAQHMPGGEAWLVGERRASGERKYHLSNLPVRTTLKRLAATIKARWVCEQAHQQLKEELGLDHFQGRSWTGLHRHALLSLIAYLFLQSERLAQKNLERPSLAATTRAAATEPAGGAPCPA